MTSVTPSLLNMHRRAQKVLSGLSREGRTALTSPTQPHLLLLPGEAEDGRLAGVMSNELADPTLPPSEVEPVFREVVGEVGQTGVLPALIDGFLTLALRGGGGEERTEEKKRH